MTLPARRDDAACWWHVEEEERSWNVPIVGWNAKLLLREAFVEKLFGTVVKGNKEMATSSFFVFFGLIFSFLVGCGSNEGIKDSKTESDADVNTDTVLDAGADTGSDPLPSWPSGKYISIDEVYKRVQAKNPDNLLLNVSDEEFYNLGHIEGSLQIPWNILEDNLTKVDSKKNIIIYCRKGVRSESAYTTLSQNDYEHIWVMEGGLEDWISKGYPTVP